MHYSLECSDLLANPKRVSPFSPDQQRRNLNKSGLSAEALIGQLLRLHLLDDTSLVSVPYLNAYVKFYRGRIPTIESAAAFARTPDAQTAIDKTLTSFDKAVASASEIYPQNRLTMDQACSQLYINQPRLLRVVAMAFIEVLPEEGRGIAKQHFATEDLSLLYEGDIQKATRSPRRPLTCLTPSSRMAPYALRPLFR